jgi:aerobic carbon-monoxide dehydrogenase medium subunit
MYPPPFQYESPTSIEEAISMLAAYGEDAKILSGGMSLIPLMKLRFASPAVIIDINRIPGLDYIQEDNTGSLRVGALVRYRTIVRTDFLRSRFPTMYDVAPQVADPVVRNRGTLVGSLCHSDPQGDFGAAMMAMGGSVIAQGPNGQREIPVDSFIVGPFQNSLNPGEMGVEARVPSQGERPFGAYMKLERKIGDFATAGVAVALGYSGSSISRAGIALTGVGSQNINATSAAGVLMGGSLNEGTIQEAARQAAAASDPKTDHRGSAEYKREVVRVFTVRALRRAAGIRAA